MQGLFLYKPVVEARLKPCERRGCLIDMLVYNGGRKKFLHSPWEIRKDHDSFQ